MTPSSQARESLSGNPYEATPGLLSLETPRAFLPLLSPGKKYKGAKGGRGSGKSHFFAERIIEECLTDPTTRVMCVREIQKSLADSVKQLLEMKIEQLGVEAYFDILDTEIHVLDDDGRRRGVVVFVGMQNHTAKSVKSFEGFRIAWVEEAQSLSQRSLDLLYPTIRDSAGEIWFSWNPEKPTDPVEVFMDPNDPEMAVVTVNYYDNPWFWETSLPIDMERDKRRDPDKYAHIWLGAYLKRSEAAVFTDWRVADFETPATVQRFYYGADWGFSIDPTVLVRCFVGDLVECGDGRVEARHNPAGKHLFIDREAYKVGCEIDETPALFAGDCPPKMLGHKGGPVWDNPHGHSGVDGALKWPITADSARPETISYMRRKGFKINPAKKGAGSVEDGIEFLKDYTIVVHSTCSHTVDELSLYSWKVDPKTDEVLPILEDKDNHVIDSLRYAVESARRAAPMQISRSAARRI